MFVLGLTGSLAMGKSATAKMFAEEGVPVHDSDATVHALYEGAGAAAIEAAFPGTVAGGKVDREKLAARVVGKPDEFARLEAIVHPRVSEMRRAFLAEAERQGAEIAVLDIPLLFETAGEAVCDAVVVVSAPADEQRRRALARPGMSEARLRAILDKQMPDAEKRRRADFIVDTSQGFAHAREQVRDILQAVRKMPKRRK